VLPPEAFKIAKRDRQVDRAMGMEPESLEARRGEARGHVQQPVEGFTLSTKTEQLPPPGEELFACKAFHGRAHH
jgi:hypothetical protein